MKIHFNNKLNRKVYELFAGDFYVVKKEKSVLTTLLGSCVSVCLYDETAWITGMNHFMLPGKIDINNLLLDEDARYGFHSMEVLINEMIKQGAKKSRLKAKLFGGGKVLKNDLKKVSENNIEFAEAFLHMENIPIVAQDVGKDYGRKLLFFTDDFSVYQRRITYRKTVEKAAARERKFYDWIKKSSTKESELTLFE